MFKNIQITNNYHFITKLNILLNNSRNMRKNVKKIGFSPKIKAFHIFLKQNFITLGIKLFTYPIFH